MKADAMSDDEMKDSWALITDPLVALRTLLANSMFLGSDPYYRDLNDALLDMAARVVKENERHCEMCGEPKDGRSHAECDKLPF